MSRPLLAACLIIAIAAPLHAQRTRPAEPPPENPTEEKFEQMFGGKLVIDMVRNATRVEAVRVEPKPGLSHPPTDIADFVQKGKAFTISDKDAAVAKSILSDRNSYLHGGDLCDFDPAVKLTFYDADGKDVSLFICLHCSEVSVRLGDKEVGFANFHFVREKMRALAADIFPDDKEMLDFAGPRATVEENARWHEGMPESLRAMWDKAMTDEVFPDVPPLKAALEKEFPDTSKRILALLEWYGSGAGQWAGSPRYETIPGAILVDFSTAELLAEMQSTTLDDRQIEGAARFLSVDFPGRHPGEYRNFPDPLKQALFDHVYKN
ncbi:MAG TPA: hypothetical protein VG733_15435, partial [Chthoniobacteraceae bacterium]|nr:hypothetical protein [Chthoniobacteraceae bacterium]